MRQCNAVQPGLMAVSPGIDIDRIVEYKQVNRKDKKKIKKGASFIMIQK